MKTAVVTGANRGIGKEIAKQLAEKNFRVIATGRHPEKIQSAAKEIGHGIIPFQLDVTDPVSCRFLYDFLSKNYSSLEVLVNNAGVIGNKPATSFDMAQLHEVMNTNLFGVINVTKALWPLLEKSAEARVINMSSGMGALHDVQMGGYAAYRLSKWSVNGYTMLLAADAPGHIKINSMCPGWVKTDMGGKGATRSVQQGADTAVWLATEKAIPSGKFFRDRKEINW